MIEAVATLAVLAAITLAAAAAVNLYTLKGDHMHVIRRIVAALRPRVTQADLDPVACTALPSRTDGRTPTIHACTPGAAETYCGLPVQWADGDFPCGADGIGAPVPCTVCSESVRNYWAALFAVEPSQEQSDAAQSAAMESEGIL